MAYLTLQYKSVALMRAVTLHVFLPNDGFSGIAVPQPFQTLYFLNGFSSSATEMLTYLTFRRQAEIKKMAIVLPDGDNAFYIDHPERLSNYETFVSKEIVEVTRNLLPLSSKREDTFIGGISMGGYGALRNGIVHSKQFSKVIAMSPAVNVYRILRELPEAGFTKELLDHLFGSEEAYNTSNFSPLWAALNGDKDSLPEIYMCCGKQDPLVFSQDKDLAAAMKAEGISITYEEDDGTHDLDYWELKLDAAFSFLTGIPTGSNNKYLMG